MSYIYKTDDGGDKFKARKYFFCIHSNLHSTDQIARIIKIENFEFQLFFRAYFNYYITQTFVHFIALFDISILFD